MIGKPERVKLHLGDIHLTDYLSIARQDWKNLIIIFGDQLDLKSSVFTDMETEQDIIWMAEVDVPPLTVTRA